MGTSTSNFLRTRCCWGSISLSSYCLVAVQPLQQTKKAFRLMDMEMFGRLPQTQLNQVRLPTPTAQEEPLMAASEIALKNLRRDMSSVLMNVLLCALNSKMK